MRDLSTSFKEAIHSPEVKSYYLYEIDPESQNPVRWTDWSEDVAYDGNVFTSALIKHSGVTMSEDGKIDPITLSVGNIDEDRYIQQQIEALEIIGKPVRIIQIIEGVTDPIETTFKVVSAKAVKGQVDFTLSLGFDFLLVSLPCRKLSRNFCKWSKFKADGCQYTGLDAECGMTWKDCQDKGNTINFGGQPGIVDQAFYF